MKVWEWRKIKYIISNQDYPATLRSQSYIILFLFIRCFIHEVLILIASFELVSSEYVMFHARPSSIHGNMYKYTYIQILISKKTINIPSKRMYRMFLLFPRDAIRLILLLLLALPSSSLLANETVPWDRKL